MLSNISYWLAALHLPNIGVRRLQHWLPAFSHIKDFFQASASDLLAAGVDQKYVSSILQPNWQQVEKDLRWSEQTENHIISLDDANYPTWLREIPDPPIVLFVKGNVQALSQIQLAIVGSRHATVNGIKTAEQFATTLAQAGYAITSGLAIGIDAASHRGALAAKGCTLAVAGTGLHHIYPPRHRALAEQIVNAQGAIVSEFALETEPHFANFPRRNRIIGGMSIGVLVIEAALQSGSLITARYAMEQNREVFAIPGSIHHPQARGCHHLIREGATLVETASDILQQLKHCPQPSTSTIIDQPVNPLPSSIQKILTQIGYENTPFDVILLRTGLTASEVSSMLLTLELEGYIQSVPGGYLRISFP